MSWILKIVHFIIYKVMKYRKMFIESIINVYLFEKAIFHM